MNSIIRPMTPKDKNSVLEMMRVFYASPAVFTNGSDDIFRTDIENCINDNPYLEGYIFEVSGEIQGYGMIAKSFSTEFGRPCMWIEDIYICLLYTSFFRICMCLLHTTSYYKDSNLTNQNQ